MNISTYQSYTASSTTLTPFSFESTDRFNLETPECLHIDLAKEAYHASNMCDYMEQMAVWLQCQKGVCLHILFLLWHYPPPSITGTDDSVDNDIDEDHGDIETAIGTSATKSPLPISWHVAKWPAFANRPISELEALYGAVNFLPMFSEFIQFHTPRAFTPSKYDQFNVYNQISIILPFNCHISLTQQLKTRIQTTPAQDACGRRPAVPAHFDTALIIKDPRNYNPSLSFQGNLSLEILASPYLTPCQLLGLCVAQVHVLFNLPPHFSQLSQPLTYVEWFTPLTRLLACI